MIIERITMNNGFSYYTATFKSVGVYVHRSGDTHLEAFNNCLESIMMPFN